MKTSGVLSVVRDPLHNRFPGLPLAGLTVCCDRMGNGNSEANTSAGLNRSFLQLMNNSRWLDARLAGATIA